MIKVFPLLNEDFNEQDSPELGNLEEGFGTYYGWITEKGEIFYTYSVPNYCPYTGVKLTQ